MAPPNLPLMYIWYEATSGFRVLPRAVAVLVIVVLRSLLCFGIRGLEISA